MGGIRWTKKEDIILRKLWENTPKDKILSHLPNRSWNALVLRAVKLKVSRDSSHINVCTTKRKKFCGENRLYKLLENTNEAYYWAGFITADGHISKKNRLQITLSLKDLVHLEKFSKFINYKTVGTTKTTCHLQIQDQKFIKEFKEKFKIYPTKTYNLQHIPIKTKTKFMSFISGFIDGDGRISKLHNRQDAHISIVGHKNSLPVFIKWWERINKLFPANRSNSLISSGTIPKLDKAGYARGFISNFEVVKQIKIYVDNLNVPIMKRKWDSIDLKLESNYAKKVKRKKLCEKLLTKTTNRSIIAEQLEISVSGTYNYF